MPPQRIPASPAGDTWHIISGSLKDQLGATTDTVGKDMGGQLFDHLPGQAKTTTDQISKELQKIQIPDINIPVTITMPDGTKVEAHATTQTFASDSGTSTIRHLAKGGLVFGTQGGLIFGASGTDTVPAMLTPGERVLSVSETSAYDNLFKDGATPPSEPVNPPPSNAFAPQNSTPMPMETNITFTIGPVDGADIEDVKGKLIPRLMVALREDAGGLRTAIESVARRA